MRTILTGHSWAVLERARIGAIYFNTGTGTWYSLPSTRYHDQAAGPVSTKQFYFIHFPVTPYQYCIYLLTLYIPRYLLYTTSAMVQVVTRNSFPPCHVDVNLQALADQNALCRMFADCLDCTWYLVPDPTYYVNIQNLLLII